MLLEAILALALPASVGLGIHACALWREDERRRRRIAARDKLDCDIWFSSFYPATQTVRVALQEVLQRLASELRVDWSQLRPDDTFAETYSYNTDVADHSELDRFMLLQDEWLKQREVRVDDRINSSRTLREYLNEIERLLREREHAALDATH